MIIDSHAHLKHGNTERTEYSPQAIVQVMDAAGIDKSVVFAICTTAGEAIAMARRAAREFPDRLIPYAYAIPHYERPVLPELEEAIASGFKGIKIHVGECTLAEYVVDPVLCLAGDAGVPCLVDCAGRHDDIARMADSFPRTKIIVAHLGRFLCTDKSLIDRFIALAQSRPNVWLDVSGVVIPYKIAEAVLRIGSARVLFGTDGPDKGPDLAGYARAEIAKIRGLELESADKDAILGGSIASLLGL